MPDLDSSRRSQCRYDWDAIAKWYDEGHTVRECAARFGFSLASWTGALRAGRVRGRPKGEELGALLTVGRRSRPNMKRRLIAAGLLHNQCYECGTTPVWRGRALVLVLDHRNGDPDDWRLSNLRLLCPNCNSQTPTFCGRNVGRNPS